MVETATELLLSNVSAGYDGMRVIDGVSLRVRHAGKLGILGRNGAGKTTTLAAIMGLVELNGGRISLDAKDISAFPAYRRARLGIGYVPQTRDVFGSLSVEQNLRVALQNDADENLDLAYEIFPRLKERRNQLSSLLSGGEQQMLSVARALMSRPKYLLLDEPLEGIAPQLAEDLMGAIGELISRTGVGCILVEQHVDVVLDFSEDVLVLERGKEVFFGSTGELRSKPHLLESAVGLDKQASAKCIN
jgi:branched-chain amino acid transport system ATP-binding protein